MILGITKESFSSRYTSVSPSGCWEWIATLNKHGYGRFWAQGKEMLAHRVSYQLFKGMIPEGLVLDHLCSNPRCVKPDHLEAVPQRINIQRGVMLQRAREYQLSKTSCPKGHPYDAANTYIRPDKGRDCRTCMNVRTQNYRRRIAAQGAL